MNKNSQYFKKDKGKMIFTGKTLEILIPLRYEMHDCLIIENTVKTLGFFDMTINGSIKSGFKLAAMVEITPSETEQVTKGTDTFFKLTLYKGDVFLNDIHYVKNTKLAYVLFYEMTYSGNYPSFLNHEDSVTIYDYVSSVTGMSFNANHAILEMMASQLARSSDDISKLYRLTDMSKKPKVLGLHSIAQLASSVTSKLNGAYMRQGLESSLANESAQTNSDIEDLLRS